MTEASWFLCGCVFGGLLFGYISARVTDWMHTTVERHSPSDLLDLAAPHLTPDALKAMQSDLKKWKPRGSLWPEAKGGDDA